MAKYILVPPAGKKPSPSGPTFISYVDERQKYVDYARGMATKYGVPADMFVRQINWESDFRPDAVSSAGATGIAQFMPATARAVGLSDSRNPYKSLEAAAMHMATLKKNLGSWRLALAAYNAGSGRVKQFGGVPPESFAKGETFRYVKGIYRNEDADESGRAGRFILVAPTLGSSVGPFTARGQQEAQARTAARAIQGPMLAGTQAPTPTSGLPTAPQTPSRGALGEATYRAFQAPNTGVRGFLNRVVATLGIPQASVEAIFTGNRKFEDMPWYTKLEDAVTQSLLKGGEALQWIPKTTPHTPESARQSARMLLSLGLRTATDPLVMGPAAIARLGRGAVAGVKDIALEGAAIKLTIPVETVTTAARQAEPVLEYGRRMFTVTPEGKAAIGTVGRAVVPSGPEWVTRDFGNIGAAKAFRQAQLSKGIEANIWKRGNRYTVTHRSRAVEPLEPAGLLGPGKGPALPGVGREITITGHTAPILEAPANPIRELQIRQPNVLERATQVAENPAPLEQAAILDATRPGFLDDALEQGVDLTKQGLIPRLLSDEAGVSRDLLAWSARQADVSRIMLDRYRTIWGHVYDNLLSFADNAVRRLGPAGEELVNRMNRVRNTSEELAGRQYDAVLQILKGTDPYKAFNRVRDVREGRLAEAVLTAQERLLKAHVDEFLDGVATKVTRAKQGLIPMSELSAEERALAQLDINLLENYWPHSLDWSKVTHHGNIRQAAIEILARKNGIPEIEARDILTHYQRRYIHGRSFGNLEKERLVPDLSTELRLEGLDEWRRYVEGYYRRIYEVQEYGGPSSPLVKDLLTQIEMTGGKSELARNLYNARMGFNPFERWQAMGEVASSVNDLQTAAKLPFAVIKNSSQLINNALIVDTKSFIRGLTRAGSRGMTKDEAVSFFNKTGLLNEETFRTLREVSLGIHREGSLAEAVLGKTGFMRIEGGLNRFTTALMGREWVRGLAAKLRGTGAQPYERSWLQTFTRKNVVQSMKRAGFSEVDIERITVNGLTDSDEIKMARWLVDETQFATHPGQIPLFASHPMGRVLLLFKSFAMKQGSLMKRAVWDYGLKQGNIKPALVLATVFPTVGEGFAYLYNTAKQITSTGLQLVLAPGTAIETIKHPQMAWQDIRRRTPQPIEKSIATIRNFLYGDQTVAEDFLHDYGVALGYLGGLGIMSDFVRATQASPGQAYKQMVSFLTGPTGSDIFTALTGGVQLARQDIPRAIRQDVEKPPTWAGAKDIIKTAIGAGVPYGTVATSALRTQLQTPRARQLENQRRADEAAARGDWETYFYYSRKAAGDK